MELIHSAHNIPTGLVPGWAKLLLSKMTTFRTKRIYTSIQALRGFAALAIVFFHISEMLLRYTDRTGLFCTLSPVWQVGASGVDLFFIISGFVMVESTRHMFQQKRASLTFFIRRLIRIVPLYWFYTTLMLILVLLPFSLQSSIFSATYTLKSFLLIPALNPANHLPLPLLPQGWTLWYELYFYILFSIFLFFDRRILLPAIFFIFITSILAGTWLKTNNPVAEVLTSPLLLEFALGCLLAHLTQASHSSARTGKIFISIGCILLFLTQYLQSAVDYRLLVWGVPAFLITLGFIFMEEKTSLEFPRYFVVLGDASYSIYLSHLFILLGISTLLKLHLVSPVIGNDFIAVLAVVLCVFLGWISYMMIESKSLSFLRSKLTLSPGRKFI